MKRPVLYYVITAFLFLMYWGYFALMSNWWAGLLAAGALMALQIWVQHSLKKLVK